MRKSNKKWQRGFINKVFKKITAQQEHFSKIIIRNLGLLQEKEDYLPKYLFKFYSPTSNNILDIRNQKLWLAHPKSFNDPFDCNIGYNSEEYEKKCLLKFMQESGISKNELEEDSFTEQDQRVIQNSYLGETIYWRNPYTSYETAKRDLINSKSKEFGQKVAKELRSKLDQMDNKIEKLKETNIRVACFSSLDRHDEFHKQILMWSHYADNHQGFCVEYNLESLKNLQQPYFSLNDLDFFDKKDEYITERLQTLIRAGLFPIEYTSSRINIPVTKLDRIQFKDNGKMDFSPGIEELIYKTFVVKSSNWSYEKEWRIIIDEHISNFFENKIPFPYARNIYLGCKADSSLIKTMIEIGQEIGAEVHQLKMDGQKFILESRGTWEYEFEKERRQWNNPFRY